MEREHEGARITEKELDNVRPQRQDHSRRRNLSVAIRLNCQASAREGKHRRLSRTFTLNRAARWRQKRSTRVVEGIVGNQVVGS